ncbi:hypothetical protein KP509_01G016400 [Ceratopteris richardii]|uniref:BHLH domain-containing protein n=1 Tax=Ceratopteris richardii TaxID=49495 RepID=A0A8T2VAS1_CERRI|nr:hypothetical protein KP509_01G016400 [Ceratopteris richardii]
MSSSFDNYQVVPYQTDIIGVPPSLVHTSQQMLSSCGEFLPSHFDQNEANYISRWNPTLYGASEADILSLPRNLFDQAMASPHNFQPSSLFPQTTSEVYQFTDRHVMCPPQPQYVGDRYGFRDDVFSVDHAPAIASCPGNTPNAPLEAVVNTNINNINVVHYPLHLNHSTSSSFMEFLRLHTEGYGDFLECVDDVAHSVEFTKAREFSQASNFKEWGKHFTPTASSFKKGGITNRCSPKYTLTTVLPRLAQTTTSLTADRRMDNTTSSAIAIGNHQKHQQLCQNENNDLVSMNHTNAERKRRRRERKCIAELRTLVPNIRKTDKVTILEDTIKFIKELQSKLHELQRLISSNDEVRLTINGGCDPCFEVHQF